MTKPTEHRIHIEQLELLARVGVTEKERQTSQRLTVNITLWPKDDLDKLSDKIERTIDYSAVCQETKNFVSNRTDQLIETMADGIAAHLLATFPIRAVTIELRKFVLPDVQYAAVIVTRAVAG